MAAAAPLLRMRDIVKSFPGVRALDGVSFDVAAGEVHALVGENGAGKSTLMKILAGAQTADGGTIEVEGAAVSIDGPRTAERLGIGMIYQEFNLVPDLGVIENVVLGVEPRRGIFLDRAAARDEAARVIAELGIVLPLDRAARRLSVAEQQLTEIAKCLVRKARLIVMDEPTAALTDRETDALFALIAKLKAQSVAFVYISHRLEELPRIADRVTVLRDGRAVETRAQAEMPPDDVIRLMVGRPLASHFPALPDVAPDAPVVLERARAHRERRRSGPRRQLRGARRRDRRLGGTRRRGTHGDRARDRRRRHPGRRRGPRRAASGSSCARRAARSPPASR